MPKITVHLISGTMVRFDMDEEDTFGELFQKRLDDKWFHFKRNNGTVTSIKVSNIEMISMEEHDEKS